MTLTNGENLARREFRGVDFRINKDIPGATGQEDERVLAILRNPQN